MPIVAFVRELIATRRRYTLDISLVGIVIGRRRDIGKTIVEPDTHYLYRTTGISGFGQHESQLRTLYRQCKVGMNHIGVSIAKLGMHSRRQVDRHRIVRQRIDIMHHLQYLSARLAHEARAEYGIDQYLVVAAYTI